MLQLVIQAIRIYLRIIGASTVANGMLDEAVLWTMSTSRRAEGVLKPPEHPTPLTRPKAAARTKCAKVTFSLCSNVKSTRLLRCVTKNRPRLFTQG